MHSPTISSYRLAGGSVDPKQWSRAAVQYTKRRYDSIQRYGSYWNQITIIFDLNPVNVLEIGPGNHFLCRQLRQRGMQVTTLDIPEAGKADVHAEVLFLPFKDRSFDCVVAFQVLEHLPLAAFDGACAELARVARAAVVISVPDQRPYLKLHAEFGLRSEPWRIKKIFTIPFVWLPAVTASNPHYWEIGRAGIHERMIRAHIQQHAPITKDYRFFENPYHHVFICNKAQKE